MSHKNVLKQLFPIELEGDFDDDITIEGNLLDEAQQRAENLLDEFYPDTTTELIDDWERFLDLTPDPGDTLQTRRDRAVAKWRERGSLSKPYFIALAAALGHTITIEEYDPAMAGIAEAGVDTVYVPEIVFCWTVKITGAQDTYMEERFNKLKPSISHVDFDYS